MSDEFEVVPGEVYEPITTEDPIDNSDTEGNLPDDD